MAGARGWQPVSGNFIQARYIRSHWEAYAEGVESIGERPDPAKWRIARSILVTDSDSEADEHLSNPDCGLHFYFRYFRRMYANRGSLDTVEARCQHDRRGNHGRGGGPIDGGLGVADNGPRQARRFARAMG